MGPEGAGQWLEPANPLRREDEQSWATTVQTQTPPIPHPSFMRSRVST